MTGRTLALLGCAALVVACSGQDGTLALSEPLRVVGGSFHSGPLPGSPPPADDAAEAEPTGTHVTLVESASNILRPGQAGKKLSGRATADATGVGIRFADMGTGYWVVSTDVLDPAAPGEITWGMSIDFAYDITPGLHDLLLSAVNDHGASGTQAKLTTCVTSEIPDNLNSCDPTIDPPALVFSLSWDSDADIDLGVVTPDGKRVDPKHPSTAVEGDAGVVVGEDDGVIDRDGNGGCQQTAARRENLVWQTKPRAGRYLVYANMFSACGASSARVTLQIWQSAPTGEGEQKRLVLQLEKSAELLASDANGGSRPGLFITELGIQ